ncbi:MAG: hypothetical protein PHH37_09395 [Paludibacter sp.]|nr:hypothetical protein [Paludibacter sp.]
MKSIKFFAIIAVLAFATVSCVENSGKYKNLLAERDSLKIQTDSLENDYNETIGILNDVEAGFASIRASENKVKVDLPGVEGNNVTKRQQIVGELTQIKEILDQNKARIEKLQRISNQQGKKNKTLLETIKRMESELNDKTAFITSLQDELAKKNIKIDELTASVNTLNQNVTKLNEESASQQTTIKSQDKDLNTVWYCVATVKQLKEDKILSSNGLFRAKTILDKDFNQSAFTQLDLRHASAISTGSKSVKILSTHPQGSYTLNKNEEQLISIEITDPQKFWSVSKYLVVQI